MSALEDLGGKVTARARMAYKVNLGNYENCDIEFELTVGGAPGESESDTLNRVAQQVEDLLVEKVKDLKS